MNNWAQDLKPLLDKYGKQKHPLDYHNRYQLVIMVLLAAQDSDKHINKIAVPFFENFPTIKDLCDKAPEDLYHYLKSVRGFRKKTNWILEIAKLVENDELIPHSLKELAKLPGIGRKSANVIIRESGDEAEGIVVDLHVVRVAPRIGVTSGTKPDKMEQELMKVFPKDQWNDAGMSFSFHGREICRPKPKCLECLVNAVCEYFKNKVSKK